MIETRIPAKKQEAAVPLPQATTYQQEGELVTFCPGVRGNVAEDVARAAAANAVGKTVIDATNPIADLPPENGVLRFFTNRDESLMERLQKLIPEA